jgi:hypothetical protein
MEMGRLVQDNSLSCVKEVVPTQQVAWEGGHLGEASIG